MRRSTEKKSEAMKLLEELSGGLPTFGEMIRTVRECEEWTLDRCARKLGVTRAYLCDIEKGRRGVSVARAARWARVLGYSEGQFVELALQEQIDSAGLKYRIGVEAA